MIYKFILAVTISIVILFGCLLLIIRNPAIQPNYISGKVITYTVPSAKIEVILIDIKTKK